MTEAELGLEQPMEEAGPRFGATAARRLLRKRLAMFCLVVILVIYMAGLLAPLVSPYGYNEQDLDNTFAGPTLAHPLGTDRLGRDMLSRVIWASPAAWGNGNTTLRRTISRAWSSRVCSSLACHQSYSRIGRASNARASMSMPCNSVTSASR